MTGSMEIAGLMANGGDGSGGKGRGEDHTGLDAVLREADGSQIDCRFV